jgi:hypothetical protein
MTGSLQGFVPDGHSSSSGALMTKRTKDHSDDLGSFGLVGGLPAIDFAKSGLFGTHDMLARGQVSA